MTRARSIGIALFCAMAAPAAAQTPQTPQAPQPTPPVQSPTLAADRAQIVACLRQAGAPPASCVGLVAVACVRAATGDRRLAEAGCARREEAVWRERLSQATTLTARALDAGQRGRLVSLQVAWEGYIAQKCAFHGARQREGLQTGRQAGCELREVALRALEIERGMVPAAAATPGRPQQGRPEIYR